jgi:hypothetical protein
MRIKLLQILARCMGLKLVIEEQREPYVLNPADWLELAMWCEEKEAHLHQQDRARREIRH